MASAAVLGVYLDTPDRGLLRVGSLMRDANRATAFIPDEAYLGDDERPILSLGWYVPDAPEQSRARLADRYDKIGLYGLLPPWFQGLLPEGALRDLVDAEMGPGDHDHFDVLLRLGADLPGGVMVIPDNAEAPDSAGPLRWDRVGGFKAPLAKGVVKFSLAGVQLKFAAVAQGERLTVPARAGDSRLILKLASDRYEGLPEAEFTGMSLAAAIGVRTAHVRLTSTDAIEGVPKDFLKTPTALVVERFDRAAEGRRIHIEDAAQILSVWGEQKYTRGNTETILNMVRRFSTDWRDDILEGVRRVVADVLLGNGDNHLKNWSFIFPGPGVVRLSPAYDIVPTVLFQPRDQLALRFAGKSKAFEDIDLDRFRRLAGYLKLDDRLIVEEVATAVRTAVIRWPTLLAEMPLPPAQRAQLLERLDVLPLIQEIRAM